jgi:phytoene/squalene synthetase
MYAVMRLVDDTIDNAGDKSTWPAARRQELHAFLDEWQERITRAYHGVPADHPLETALAWAVATFPVPLSLWRSFLDAMRFDVDTHRFADFPTFLRYAEGATVAPTTIYVYLMTAQTAPDGVYRVAGFDFESCGRQLGLFAYLSHILRDVRKDLYASERGLIYVSHADLAAHDLTESIFRHFIESGRGDARFDQLVGALITRARALRQEGLALARGIWPQLPNDCRFIFQLIVEIYSELLERIAAEPRRVLVTDRILGESDQRRIAERIARENGFPKSRLRQAPAPRRFGSTRAQAPPKPAVSKRPIIAVIAGACAATASICFLYREPWVLTAVLLGLLAAYLRSWRTRADLIGLATGAVLGNVTEVLSDVAGLWQHQNGQILGVTPSYILVCYPLLGLAMPRLVDAWIGQPRATAEGTAGALPWALSIWGLQLALCLTFAGDSIRSFGACALCLALFLWRFRSKHDQVTLLFGVGLGLLWELPCTGFGAWRFPQTELFGRVPLWLPLAYAVFFGTLGRVTIALCAGAMDRPAGRRELSSMPSKPKARFTTPSPNNA